MRLLGVGHRCHERPGDEAAALDYLAALGRSGRQARPGLTRLRQLCEKLWEIAGCSGLKTGRSPGFLESLTEQH